MHLKTPSRAWAYNPGTRRVRSAPDIAYDYKPSSNQGLQQQISLMDLMVLKIDMNGHLIGTQKRLMPYNAYKFHETKIEEF